MVDKSNEVELRIILNNGSNIYLKGADNEDSLRGVNISFVVMDEISFMKRNVWQEIIRPMLLASQGKCLFIGTPQGKNHFWELWLKGNRKEDDFASWQYKTSDNPYIKLEEIEEARKTTSDRVFRQEYEASFEDYVGLVYPEFDQNIHIIQPVKIEAHWERIGAIDPAITGTTAALFGAVDEKGDIYLYSEYYEQNKRVSEVAQVLKQINNSTQWRIDPSSVTGSKINNENRVYSLFDEYIDNGIVPLIANNDVEGGINRVAEYFKRNKIKVFSTLKNFIYEIERYHWAEERETNTGFMKPVPYKSLDHLMDDLKYIVASRPVEAEKPSRYINVDYDNRTFENLERERKEVEKVLQEQADRQESQQEIYESV